MIETAPTVAGLRPTGVRGARQLQGSQVPVTLAILPQSKPYTRDVRDAAPFAGWTAPVLGLGTGREREGGSLKRA